MKETIDQVSDDELFARIDAIINNLSCNIANPYNAGKYLSLYANTIMERYAGLSAEEIIVWQKLTND